MTENIRGIECSLYNGKVEDLLIFLSNKPFDFYIRWCMKIDNKRMLLPKSLRNFRVLPDELKQLARDSIWELVLDVYPVGSSTQRIETYDDFLDSPCVCCLIYYDCGSIDIYVKDPNLRDQLYSLLSSLQAKEIALISDVSDNRICLSL